GQRCTPNRWARRASRTCVVAPAGELRELVPGNQDDRARRVLFHPFDGWPRESVRAHEDTDDVRHSSLKTAQQLINFRRADLPLMPLNLQQVVIAAASGEQIYLPTIGSTGSIDDRE